MTQPLHIVDPTPDAAWAPFATSRPVAELRAGRRRLREWWEAFTGEPTVMVHTTRHLVPFPEGDAAPVASMGPIRGPAIVGLAEFLPFGTLPAVGSAGATMMQGDRPVGWVVPTDRVWHPDDPGVGTRVAVEGLRLAGAFDLVTALEQLLTADLEARVKEGPGDPLPPGTTVLGEAARIGNYAAVVERGAVLDVRGGPIVLEPGALVRSDTRLEGPAWIGPKARVTGGPLRQVVIGPRCNARGEMASTIMLGYGNKAHDGFVGHSVIGCWANLGAGTITSNLKNTYGPIALDVAGTPLRTGRQLMGSLIGDHAKTAIGTLLGTGTVVGCGANVFGAMRPPKWVPAFAWGADGVEYMRRDGFLTIAGRVLPRREVTVDDAVQDFLRRLYDAHMARQANVP